MTESCGSKNRTGRSLPQRRPATNVALGPAGFDHQKQSLIHYLLSKAGRTPGRYCRGVEAASKRRCASRPWAGVRPARLCEPQEHGQQFSPNHDQRFSPILSGSGCALPGWAEGPARRPGDPKGSQQFHPPHRPFITTFCHVRLVAHSPEAQPTDQPNARSHFIAIFCQVRPRRGRGRHQRRAATSSDELQPSPCRGGGLRDPKGRKSMDNSSVQPTAQFSAPCPPHCGSAFAPPVPLGTRQMGVSTPKRRPR